MKTIIPLNEYVLIELLDTDKTTPSGLIVPDEVKKRQAKGKIVRLGYTHEDYLLKENDIVWFKQFAGEKILEDGKEYYIVPYVDVLATVKTT